MIRRGEGREKKGKKGGIQALRERFFACERKKERLRVNVPRRLAGERGEKGKENHY